MGRGFENDNMLKVDRGIETQRSKDTPIHGGACYTDYLALARFLTLFASERFSQMTKEDRGKPVCLLVRRVNLNTKNETWNNFTPVPKKSPEDDDIFNTLGNDGLKLGEWITVPDPFEKDWPFAKRYPGARCPPEPACDSPYLERS